MGPLHVTRVSLVLLATVIIAATSAVTTQAPPLPRCLWNSSSPLAYSPPPRSRPQLSRLTHTFAVLPLAFQTATLPASRALSMANRGPGLSVCVSFFASLVLLCLTRSVLAPPSSLLACCSRMFSLLPRVLLFRVLCYMLDPLLFLRWPSTCDIRHPQVHRAPFIFFPSLQAPCISRIPCSRLSL